MNFLKRKVLLCSFVLELILDSLFCIFWLPLFHIFYIHSYHLGWFIILELYCLKFPIFLIPNDGLIGPQKLTSPNLKVYSQQLLLLMEVAVKVEDDVVPTSINLKKCNWLVIFRSFVFFLSHSFYVSYFLLMILINGLQGGEVGREHLIVFLLLFGLLVKFVILFSFILSD